MMQTMGGQQKRRTGTLIIKEGEKSQRIKGNYSELMNSTKRTY